MVDLLSTGAAWLAGVLKTHASQEVEYRRGAVTFLVQATFAITQRELNDADGFTVATFVTDFLIAYADLGEDPVCGDIIVANGEKFELLELGDQGCWRWTDGHRNMVRIHTKDIGIDD